MKTYQEVLKFLISTKVDNLDFSTQILTGTTHTSIYTSLKCISVD